VGRHIKQCGPARRASRARQPPGWG
jgi:hypothetical protein